MNTQPRTLIKVLLLSLLMLAWAGSARAVSITVDSETLWSTITSGSGSGGQPSASDDITIVNGGKLWVDVNTAQCRNLTIGNASSFGILQFQDSNSRLLTVNGTLDWGGTVSGNAFLMSGTSGRASTAVVLGSVFPDGAGSFQAGLGVVQYAASGSSGNQTVAPLAYKDLDLIGSGTKTLTAGITVNGALTIGGTATVAGNQVTYGSLATLTYSGTAAQTTTDLEFPSGMTKPVTIANAVGVSLNNSKILNGQLTINAGALLLDNGNQLLLNSTVANNGTHQGTGQIVFNTASISIIGAGHYGNVGVSANVTAPLTFNVDGRLTINNPSKLTLPTSLGGSVQWLSFGSPLKHQPAGVYTAASGGGNVFAGSGTLSVASDVIPVFVGIQSVSFIYGQTSISLSGQVKGTMVNNNKNYGTVYPENGNTVTVTIKAPGGATVVTANTTTFGGDGEFAFPNLSTGSLTVGSTYSIVYSYPGGNNLAAAADDSSTTITVSKRPLTIIAQNTSKRYGDPDPILLYTVNGFPYPGNGALLTGDTFATSPVTYNPPAPPATAAAGAYPIVRAVITDGTIINSSGGNAGQNYDITVVPGATMTVNPRTITIVPIAASKTYNGLSGSDPALTYNVVTNGVTVPSGHQNDVLVGSDTFTGSLGRASGNHAGNYAINQGGVTISPPASLVNYNLQFTSGVNFSINKLDETVTPNSGQTKVYGVADATALAGSKTPGYPDFTWSTDPASLGDSFSGHLARASGEAVNTYAIANATGSSALSLSSDYNLTVVSGKTFAITKADLNVTAAQPGPTITYGQAFPATKNGFVVYSGLVNGDTAPATQATYSTSAVSTSPPGAYSFTVTQNAADNNYNIHYPSPQSGTLTISKATLTLTADNKSKQADGTVYTPFTYTPTGLVYGDTVASSTSGNIGFIGTAVTAIAAGTYYNQIILDTTTVTSSKYIINPQPGTLTLTAPIGTTTISGNATWSATTAPITFEINAANGSAGASPGWSKIAVTGQLTIGTGPIIVNLVTLPDPSGRAPIGMAKFDPTRSWKWLLASSAGVLTFNASQFQVVTSFFQNQTFGGTFSISADANNLYVNFTPFVPGGSDSTTIGLLNDTTHLLGNVYNSDVPVLYLQVQPGGLPPTSAGPVTINPNQPCIVNLNVGNLGANVSQPYMNSVQAYIAFSSSVFNGVLGSQGGPVVATVPGSDWGNLISTVQYVSGDLDVVVGVKLTLSGGTRADGTVAQLTLTPTKHTTASSRVAFRDQTSSSVSSLTDIDGHTVVPAVVETEQIKVTGDTTGPVITAFTATEVQPHKGAPPFAGSVTVTNGINTTVRGTVNFQVQASDAGVGLAAAPTIRLVNGANTVNLTSSDSVPPVGQTGTFNYTWVVDGNTPNGTWTATVTANDNIQPPNSNSKAFSLRVNVNEVDGVVQLESFAGTNRNVTFFAGVPGGTISGGTLFSNTLNLNFTSAGFVAGSFPNREAYAQEVAVPTQSVSSYFHYGDINGLQTFVGQFMQQTSLSQYLQSLEFGSFSDLHGIAVALTQPTRAVDFYVSGRLSSSTKNYLSVYLTTPNSVNAQNATIGLLTDFTGIINGANIYNAVTFNGITFLHTSPPPPSPFTTWEAYYLALPSLTAYETAVLNRMLLFDAYPTQFVEGILNPQTPAQLLAYSGGADTLPQNVTLKTNLLVDLSTVEALPGPSLYTPARFYGVVLRPSTTALLLSNNGNGPTPGSTEMITLNRNLLEDAYAFTQYPNYSPNYDSGPISADTMNALAAYLAAPTDPTKIGAFENGMTNNLNVYIGTGTLIYNANRWAAFYGGFTSDMLAGLPPNPPPTGTNLVRLNRQLLEAAFTTPAGQMLIIGSQYASFRLTDVPAGTLNISARTSWNLQRVQGVTMVNGIGTAALVNSGVPATLAGQYGANDYFLRGGDLNGDNVVNTLDYNKLVQNYPLGAGGDVNGDGVTGNPDYLIFKNNYLQGGDPNF